MLDPQEKDRVIYEKSQQEEGRDRDLWWEEQYQDVGKSVQRLKEHWLGVAQYFSFRYVLKNFEVIFRSTEFYIFNVARRRKKCPQSIILVHLRVLKFSSNG